MTCPCCAPTPLARYLAAVRERAEHDPYGVDDLRGSDAAWLDINVARAERALLATLHPETFDANAR